MNKEGAATKATPSDKSPLRGFRLGLAGAVAPGQTVTAQLVSQDKMFYGQFRYQFVPRCDALVEVAVVVVHRPNLLIGAASRCPGS